MLNTPGHPGVPAGHPANNFKYAALKETYGSLDNGDIVINKEKEEPKVEKEVASAVEINGKSSHESPRKSKRRIEACA